MARVYIGVGSNLGDREANIKRAIELAGELKDTKLEKTSSLSETDPVGGPEQGKFLNGVIEITTSILPVDLLAKLKWIERRLGRKKNELNGPRPIDLDLLFYDDVVIKGKELTIPHPSLEERLFVLQPLAEIAPGLVHPVLGKDVSQLLSELTENFYADN